MVNRKLTLPVIGGWASVADQVGNFSNFAEFIAILDAFGSDLLIFIQLPVRFDLTVFIVQPNIATDGRQIERLRWIERIG